MIKTDFIIDRVVVYLFCMYMLAMTGLYFHMDSRIEVLQTIQFNSLEMFKKYSEKDIKQQADIDGLSGKIESLKNKLENIDDSIDSKLTNLSRLILGVNTIKSGTNTSTEIPGGKASKK
ncbi:hypothetical protein JZU46_00295 [bacterium]|nr:hypothetical protein [bacterium]